MRFGIGYDVHRFSVNRKLILGGVEIPFVKGLMGHSDADVLCHAIADALLGAAALGDIGKHFPDADPKFAGISSIVLLQRVGELLEEHHFEIINIDSTVVLQQPKISPFIKRMRDNIAEALKLQPGQVSVKATTNDEMGSIGLGEGAAAYAVTSLKNSKTEAA